MKPEIVSAEREAELRRRAHILLDAAPCADMIIPVPEAAALLDELAELRATLLAERGDPAGALPGWAWSIGRAMWIRQPWLSTPPGPGIELRVWRDGRHMWTGNHDDAPHKHVSAQTAREAMRSLDLALASLTPSRRGRR